MLKSYQYIGNIGMLITTLGIIIHLLFLPSIWVLGISTIIGVAAMAFCDFKAYKIKQVVSLKMNSKKTLSS